MSKDVILKAEGISKQYRLGKVGTGTISHDLNRWWAGIRGKEDPYLKIGETNDRSVKGSSDYVWALQDISFEVKQGEVLGIIGKNGAGKSTLLKILSRVTSPTTGSIKTKGRIASLLEVGTGFHPEMTGRENIFLNGAILGMTKKEIKSKIDEIIEFSGCQRYIDTPVKRYSSGMTVRLAFAVAAFLEPEILVVDEVLAVGDAEFQKKAIGKMQDISKSEGRTVLFVSHNMAAVKSLCTKGLVIENGTVVFHGSIDDAVSKYFQHDSEKQKVKLSEREDRIGNGLFKFEGISFLDSTNNYVSEVISGESVRIELEYSKKTNFDASKIILSLIFRDNLKQIITSFVSDEVFSNLNITNDKGVIVLEIPRLMLRGENYEIMLLSFDGDTGHKDALDIIEDACFINVLQGNFSNRGKLDRKGFSNLSAGTYSNK